jgi:hypothetical protein
MALIEIISAAGSFASLAQPVVEWGIERGKTKEQTKLNIAKAFQNYKAELKLNHAILQKIKLDEIDTKDITNPAIKGIASKLKTKAAENLLLSMLTLIQEPKKAVKALPVKKPGKADAAEAKKIIAAIIFVMEKIRELQCFTTLSEAEKKILKGFYVKKRLKNIKEKTLFISKNL